jgi:hypothetical protein
MPPRPTRDPAGLACLGTAVALILLLIGSAMLMNIPAGHASAPGLASAAEHSDNAPPADGSTGSVRSADAPSAESSTADDRDALCAIGCSIMGMACLMVLIVSAVTLLHRRGARALFILSRVLGSLPGLPPMTIPLPAPNLAQLSILRV